MEGVDNPPTKVLGSEYALKYLENFSAKSVDESKASVYFTPNDDEQASPEPQISPIHINYLNGGGHAAGALGEDDDVAVAIGDLSRHHLSGAAASLMASGDTPKSFKSVIGGGAAGPFGGVNSADIPLKSIMKPTTRFMYDKHLGKYRLCHQQPNRLSGGYAHDEDDLALADLMDAAGSAADGVPLHYGDGVGGRLDGGEGHFDSGDDDHHNYSLKNNRKHRRKRKIMLGPMNGGGGGGGGGSGSGGSGSASACEYETLLMKNLSHDPRDSHYKIIHVNKLNNGVSNSNYFGGMLGTVAPACGSGWMAGRAVSRRHHRPTAMGPSAAAAAAAAAASSSLAGDNDYYYSLEDMIQDSNQKIRQLIYDSKIDIMNEVISTGAGGNCEPSCSRNGQAAGGANSKSINNIDGAGSSGRMKAKANGGGAQSMVGLAHDDAGGGNIPNDEYDLCCSSSSNSSSSRNNSYSTNASRDSYKPSSSSMPHRAQQKAASAATGAPADTMVTIGRSSPPLGAPTTIALTAGQNGTVGAGGSAVVPAVTAAATTIAHHPLKKIHKLHFDSSTNRIQQSTSLPEIYFDAAGRVPRSTNGTSSMAEPAPPAPGSPNHSGSTISSTFSSASGSLASGAAVELQPAKVHGGKHVILAVENKESAALNIGGSGSSSTSSSKSPSRTSSSTSPPPASPIESNININDNSSISSSVKGKRQ